MLGNDIVDLLHCEVPRYLHVHHLDRGCTPEEAGAVRRSVNPAKAFALLWASKESAYKLISKKLVQCNFVPRQFVAQIENRDPAQIDQNLLILYAGIQTQVSLFASERWVHAVAVSGAMNIHSAVREIKNCSPGNCGVPTESEAVRFLANALINELELENVRLQFEKRIPRLTREDGGPTAMDVSLSHHGAFAAAAIASPARPPRSKSGNEAGFAQKKTSEAVCSTYTA